MTYLLIYLAIGTVYSIIGFYVGNTKHNHEFMTNLYNENESVNQKWSYKKFYYMSWIAGFFIGLVAWPVMILIRFI